MLRTRFGVVVVALGALPSVCSGGSQEPADMVFTNGVVYTVDDANRQAEAYRDGLQ